MRKLYYIIFLLFAVLSNASAAMVNVSATMDSTTLLIGEQRVLRLEAKYPKSVEMKFPDLEKESKLAEGIEILRKHAKDTVSSKDGMIQIRQEFIVTSFDTGRYEIPPFRFTTSDQHYMTDRIIVDVVTIEEDFAQASLKSNNDIYRPPFNFKRLFQYISLLLIVLGIGMIAALIVIYMKKKTESNIVFDTIDKRSPREIALADLNEIKEEKVWMQGEQKKYHTQITDTLRHYFTERFKMPAMEMTSDEIFDELKNHEESSIVEDKVRQVFKLSDMVKFAKYEASHDENEMSIMNALFIVQQTSQIDEQNKTAEESTTNSEEKEFRL